MWTRTLWVFLGSQASFLAFPEPTCGSKRLSGAFGGRPCFKTHRKPRAFARFFAFLCYPTCIVLFLFFFQKCYENHAFSRIFGAAGGGGFVSAFPLFGVARSPKTASETIIWAISSLKNDFGASEAVCRHFPSPIEPCMVRKYSFRGSRNSFWTFPMADPEAHLRHFLGLGSKMLILNYSMFVFGISRPQLGPKMPTLRFPKLILGISWALDRMY